MSSYELGWGGADGAGGAGDRLGHWGPRILIGAIVAAMLLVVEPLPYDSVGALLLPVLVFAVVVASWVLMRQHDRRLCEWCMSSMPLNAAEVAARQHRRLTVAHLASDRRLVVGYLLVLVASHGLLMGLPGVPDRPAAYLWAAVQSTMIYLVLSYTTHRRLQPWCPRCSDEDGGGHHEERAPDPILPSGWAG